MGTARSPPPPKRWILLPWHIAGAVGHWTLGIADLETGELLFYDSLPAAQPRRAALNKMRTMMQEIEKALKSIEPDGWPHLRTRWNPGEGNMANQGNTLHCAIYVMAAMRERLTRTPAGGQIRPDEARAHITLELTEHKLHKARGFGHAHDDQDAIAPSEYGVGLTNAFPRRLGGAKCITCKCKSDAARDEPPTTCDGCCEPVHRLCATHTPATPDTPGTTRCDGCWAGAHTTAALHVREPLNLVQRVRGGRRRPVEHPSNAGASPQETRQRATNGDVEVAAASGTNGGNSVGLQGGPRRGPPATQPVAHHQIKHGP